MLHINGLVDNDRLPPYKDGAVLHQYRLWWIDQVLRFRREFTANDNNSTGSEAACDLTGEFHGSKKQGWWIGGISPLNALTLAFLIGPLSELPHPQL